MTTSMQEIEKFTNSWTTHISKSLAENIIAQVGGVDKFTADFERIIEHLTPKVKYSNPRDIDSIQGFYNTAEMMAFFENNRADLVKFVRSHGAEDRKDRGIVSGIELIRLATIRYNLSHDQISDVLHNSVKTNEKPSNECIIIGQWLAKTALLHLCNDYRIFLTVDDFFNGDTESEVVTEQTEHQA